MDAERWEHVQAVFHDAVERPPSERAAFVTAACDGDAGPGRRPFSNCSRRMRAAGRCSIATWRTSRTGCWREPADGPLPGARGRPLRDQTAARRRRDGRGLSRRTRGSRQPRRRSRFCATPGSRRPGASASRASSARSRSSTTRSSRGSTTRTRSPTARPWFVMEYVEGRPLTEYCDARRSTLPERLRLFRDVCDAVQHAHQHLVVHRDLKPSNILVTDGGRGEAARLRDRQAARDAGRRSGTDTAHARPADDARVRGARADPRRARRASTPMCTRSASCCTSSSPGRLRSISPIGHRAKRTPSSSSARLQRPSFVNRTAPRPLHTGGSSWADLDVLCLTAMHKDPGRRYQTVEALVRDIDRYLKGEPLEARGDSLRYRAGKFVRRHAWSLSAAVLAVAVLATLVAFYTARVSAARDAALAEAARTQRIQRFMLSLFEGGDNQVAPAADLRVVTLLDRGVREARSLDGEPAIQAELYHTLGTIYQGLGKHVEADALLQAALDGRRRVSGGAHADTANSLVALGLLRKDQARLEEAEQLVRDGLDGLRRALPPQHPAVARALAALGLVLQERGKLDEALPPLDEAVRVFSASPSEEAELAVAITTLANLHFDAGRLDVSETMNKRALEMDRRIHGERHPHVADDLLNLGSIQSSRGHHAEAAAYNRDALAILEAWYGADHPETASAMTILAQSLSPQQKYEEASVLLRRASETQERVYGLSHPRVAFVLNELGLVAFRRKDLVEAEHAFRRTLEIYRAAYDGRQVRVGIAMANLASVYLARGQHAQAEQLFTETIALYRTLLPADHVNIGIAESKLGRTLVRQRRHREAEAHLLTAQDIFVKQPKSSLVWLQTAREDLIAVYDALNQPERAATIRLTLDKAQAR